MKKIIIFILCFMIVIISVFYAKYVDYKAKENEIKENNLAYEFYTEKEIYGTELTSVINKAVDNNEKNSVPKDEQGFYKKNDTNSVNIEIKMIDNDTTYEMETLYNGGMTNFVQYYNSIYFKCAEIKYNSLGKVSSMLFEQVST